MDLFYLFINLKKVYKYVYINMFIYIYIYKQGRRNDDKRARVANSRQRALY